MNKSLTISKIVRYCCTSKERQNKIRYSRAHNKALHSLFTDFTGNTPSLLGFFCSPGTHTVLQIRTKVMGSVTISHTSVDCPALNVDSPVNGRQSQTPGGLWRHWWGTISSILTNGQRQSSQTSFAQHKQTIQVMVNGLWITPQCPWSFQVSFTVIQAFLW